MTKDPAHNHPDYGGIRGGAKYDVMHFEDTNEDQELGYNATEEVESNELHAATGTICEHCKQPIADGAEVRRLVSGGYVHELCPR
jgi:hypothetical protein